MRLFANRYLLLLAFIAAAVLISEVNAKMRLSKILKPLRKINKKYPKQKQTKISKPVKKPASWNDEAYEYDSSSYETNESSGESVNDEIWDILNKINNDPWDGFLAFEDSVNRKHETLQSHGHSDRRTGSTTLKPDPPSSKITPTSAAGNWTNQDITIPSKNNSGTNQKPGATDLYHDNSGNGSGFHQTTLKPDYPSSKRTPTSAAGNWTNKVKNDSWLIQNHGFPYPPDHGVSDGGSQFNQTTHKPLFSPAILPAVNISSVIYKPLIEHHIYETYESSSHYMPHRKVNTYYYRTKYVYAPPHTIYFRHSHRTFKNYPVYKGHYIPAYVNDYRQSENKYGELLTGLALYNLGMISNGVSMNNFSKQYYQKPDEICIFEAKYEIGYADEMAIDCIIMSFFIFMEENKNTNFDDSSRIIYEKVILPNGNFQITRPGGTIVYGVSDPIFYGKPVDYKLLKECNIGRSKRNSGFKKEIPCGLLQAYAENSFRANSGPVLKSSLSIISIIIVAVSIIFN